MADTVGVVGWERRQPSGFSTLASIAHPIHCTSQMFFRPFNFMDYLLELAGQPSHSVK